MYRRQRDNRLWLTTGYVLSRDRICSTLYECVENDRFTLCDLLNLITSADYRTSLLHLKVGVSCLRWIDRGPFVMFISTGECHSLEIMYIHNKQKEILFDQQL